MWSGAQRPSDAIPPRAAASTLAMADPAPSAETNATAYLIERFMWRVWAVFERNGIHVKYVEVIV
jgi:hypothetical protein